ncbi:MAG: DUF2007 domain-containing protein [Paludibacteraceae bacterium]|nr:DUF2007 domain-containing protein [Paludibacteraceae bacterium]
MEEDKLVSVKYYETVIEAEIDQNVLKTNGIECIYNDDTVVGVFPIFDDKERGIELMVFEKDVEKARQILDEYHAAVDTVADSDEDNQE